jgi:hypothetical protein
MVKNKKGWIKIAEAFLAILLLTAVLLIIITGQDVEEEKGKIMSKMQGDFLKNIQINETCRRDIVDLGGNFPVNSSETGFPSCIETKLQEEFGESCMMVICLANMLSCEIGDEQKKEIYVKSILINSYKNEYRPKLVKLVCYE